MLFNLKRTAADPLKKVRKSSNQSLQHFITHSSWNERIVIDRIQKKVSKIIGDSVEVSLHIIEAFYSILRLQFAIKPKKRAQSA